MKQNIETNTFITTVIAICMTPELVWYPTGEAEQKIKSAKTTQKTRSVC